MIFIFYHLWTSMILTLINKNLWKYGNKIAINILKLIQKIQPNELIIKTDCKLTKQVRFWMIIQ